MSRLIVEVCEVVSVEPHPNADRLAIATVKGWKTCITYNPEIQQAQFKPGDKCVYFPPDSVMPVGLSDRLGITKYLSPLPRTVDEMEPTRYRVRAARLRGVPSYGVIMAASDNPDWKAGDDVGEYYKITKWEPPERHTPGETESPHPKFHRYTDIEYWRNFPNIFEENEEVVITEKLHGMNCRLGYIIITNELGDRTGEFMCGSHEMRRREISREGRQSEFWIPLTETMRAMLVELSDGERNIIVFGEIFGHRIQDMAYGLESNRRDFRLFDIAVDGRYVDHDDKTSVCERFGIKMVPVLYRGPYNTTIVEKLTNGPTAMCPMAKAGKFTGREGIVITPVKERFSSELKGPGRVILKSVSVDYLARKNQTDSR